MLVFIDESGCPGFKLGKGSTPHFVAAMVRFADYGEAERASAAIRRTRDLLGVKPEFKFAKCCDHFRDAFFETVAEFDFRVRAIVVEKARVYSANLRGDCDSFYNFFVRSMLKYDNGTLRGASVKIDGSGDREFKRALAAYLRRHVGPGKIGKVAFADSKGDNLLQLADMCAGAIARSYRAGDRPNADRWRRMLKPKTEDVWEFGRGDAPRA